MSDRRDELVQLRNKQFKLVEEQRRLGDYGAGAAHARDHAETTLRLLDLLLEKTR
jgi:hypothetical protein